MRTHRGHAARLLHKHAAVVAAGLTQAIEERRERALFHPVAGFQVEQKALGLARLRDAVALDLHVRGIKVRGARGYVHAEFPDVIERLLAAEAVLVAAQEFAVVVQLDRTQGLVLAVLVARRDLDRLAAVVVTLRFYEVVD